MKLISFEITADDGFRSLQKGFKIKFPHTVPPTNGTFYPRILAGRNGSGKSNILEALANIFFHIDCMYCKNLPDSFSTDDENEKVFDNRVCAVDEFILEYYIPIDSMVFLKKDIRHEKEAHVQIKKEVGTAPTISWLNQKDYTEPTKGLDNTVIRKLLPDYVLGYSSGDNELLSLPFFKTRFIKFDEYADRLTQGYTYGFPPSPESRLTFLDHKFSQAIFLTNLLTQDEKVLKPITDIVEVNNVTQFRLIIHQSKHLLKQNSNEEENQYVELTSNLTTSINNLKKCSTCYSYEEYQDENHPNQEGKFGEDLHYHLYLDFKVNEETKKAFKFYFTPIELFELFQILLELDTYVITEADKKHVYKTKNIFINTDIVPYPPEHDKILRFKDLKITKDDLPKSIYTKQLSDGEHQLLHTMGLSLLYKNKRCLFLLDEPETHFNPDWKAQFISSIRECFKGSNTKQEMLITTHSPYLISDSKSSYVHIFEKDEKTQEVICHEPEFQTLGASVNKITIQIFKTPITVGNYALEFLDEIEKRFEKGEDSKTLIKELEENLGDSVEKTLLIHKLEA